MGAGGDIPQAGAGRGVFADQPLDTPSAATPWHLPPWQTRTPAEPGSAIVVGAGLAGCTAAAALARRRWTVTVFDADTVAAAASGNRQGALYCRLSHRSSPLSEWSLHSYRHALEFYRDLLGRNALRVGEDADLCGALHLGIDYPEDHPIYQTLTALPGLARLASPEEAADISGLPRCDGGLFFPDAGWVHPAALCRALLRHPGITLAEGAPVTLRRERGQWRACDRDGNSLARAAVAVVATGTACAEQPGLEWVPMASIRGQVTHLPSTGDLAGLKTVICHDGYIAPSVDGEHCIGATFQVGLTGNADNAGLCAADHGDNLQKLRLALPGANWTEPGPLGALPGRVGFRAVSPDYLPLVGPVPDLPAFCEDYAPLRRNARQRLPHRGSYLEGLYLSTGHGSRGLTSTPLAAELLASQICGEPWPVGENLVRALSPARFPVRDLARGRL